MDLIDRLRELSALIPKQLEHIQTEEATKSALVLPFIAALGYNVFDPREVTPELNADVGIKKGEKVDYAILREGKPVILIECKHHAADLAKAHASQLYRYFSVTEARFGLLTNGLMYWFFTDLEAPNKMDAKPFFEFNMLDIREPAVAELKKFSKSAFDLNNILTTASELKYTREIRRVLLEQLQQPSDEFVKLVTAQVYTGRMTHTVKEQFAQLTRQAFAQLVNDQINERLKSALATVSVPDATVTSDTVPPDSPTKAAAPNANGASEDGTLVETTDTELEGFYIVRAILREIVNVKRITMRDVQSYCGLLLDDNNRKPICRLHFNRTQKYLGLFVDEKEERVPINEVDDIYVHAGRLKQTVQKYIDAEQSKKGKKAI
jgi:predicted type IV restriction endonuclease